jgi:hypothetical protein
MNDHGFDGAPEMGREFGQSHNAFERPLEYDAQNWEPTEEPEIEELSEKHLEMHLTPGGSIEQEVHTELDEAARARILEAQRDHESVLDLPDEAELNFSGDFEDASGSWREERDARVFDREPFDTGRRFERGRDAERGQEEWDR